VAEKRSTEITQAVATICSLPIRAFFLGVQRKTAARKNSDIVVCAYVTRRADAQV